MFLASLAHFHSVFKVCAIFRRLSVDSNPCLGQNVVHLHLRTQQIELRANKTTENYLEIEKKEKFQDLFVCKTKIENKVQ